MERTGYIYKLVCSDVNVKDIYVGSTTNERLRKHTHKSSCYNQNDKKFNMYAYQFIRDNGGFSNWDMIRIEEYKFNDKIELKIRERYWIENLQATLNSRIPSKTRQEWTNENRDKVRGYFKKYDNSEKGKLKNIRFRKGETFKQWQHNYYRTDEYKKNEKLRRENRKEELKDYYNKNKETLLQKQKERDERNKDKILQRQKEKVPCECGKTITKQHTARHKKSNQHKFYEETYNFIYS